MKSERIIWGLLFVFIGGILLLDNLEVLNFQWEIIWRFWPLVLIIIGANLVFSREDSARTEIVGIVITIAALAFIGYKGSRPESSRTVWADSFKDEHDADDSHKKLSTSRYSESVTPGINFAKLNIQGGATEYQLSDSTNMLFQADVKERGGNYSLFKTTKDSTDNIDFKMHGHQRWENHEAGTRKAVLKLNTKPVWDINAEIGAGKIKFDLAAFKIRNLRLQGGAASFQVKLGLPQMLTTIHADTGVSEIVVSIPETAACQISVDSGLSSNNFNGFEKQADGTYTTSNFKSATNKFMINLNGGLSKFEVKRY